MKFSALTFSLIVGLAAAAKPSVKKPAAKPVKKPAAKPVKKPKPVVTRSGINVSLGPRPYFLVDSMKPSALKDKLSTC